jgi:hypothetical protein
MEIAILAVLSMAVGSLITGGLVVLATRPRRRPRSCAEPRDVLPVSVSAEDPPEDGRPTMDAQFAAIFGHEYRGGLKIE